MAWNGMQWNYPRSSWKTLPGDLNISIKTVEAHRANIMDKLQVTTVADLLKIALRKSPELAQP